MALMRFSDDITYQRYKPLTKYEFAELFLQQQGLCSTCSTKLELKPYKIHTEHLNQRALSGSNSHNLDNIALTCVPCSKVKNAADAKARAKVRRLLGVNKVKPKQKIPSRKFNQKIKPNIKDID